VEFKLKLAGIKVVTQEESSKLPGNAWLYLRLSYLRASGHIPIMACSTELQLKQTVLLERNPSLIMAATTWQKGGISVGSTKNPSKGIHDDTDQHTNEFINNYLSANPK
jgi:hypothetical protein